MADSPHNPQTIFLPDEDTLFRLAGEWTKWIEGGDCFYLFGELGTGKTTFVKAIVKALGGDPDQIVSPSYPLLNRYSLKTFTVIHLDLYRLKEPAEILSLDLEPPQEKELIFIEWPERGEGFLPPPSWIIHLEFGSEGRSRLMKGQRLRGAPAPPARYTFDQSPQKS